MEKIIKTFVLLPIVLIVLLFSFSAFADNNTDNYVYNGPARLTILCSDNGVLTLKQLAILKGYKPINNKVIYKYGRYYGLSKVKTNAAGLIIYARYELLK